MNRWLKRTGTFIFLLLWLMVMIFPTFAFFLATNGQVQLGDEARRHVRFFLVQEETSGGVGMEWVRGVWQADNCTRTTIHYFLWEGNNSGQNVSFCQCYDPVTDAPLPVEESNCTR